jgi:predicted NUDIX family phosphoesterase
MEQVFVVRRSDFFDGNWPSGYSALAVGESDKLLERFVELGFFAARGLAEDEAAWKQLIPYCVIRRPGEVFCVQRKTAQTESRLHGLLSIGIGGHINPDPDQARRPSAVAFFEQALLRELFEELHLEPEDASPRLLGILNDDSTAVGRVHLGLVYGLDLPSPGPGRQNPRVREISKMQGGFRRLRELQSHVQNPGRFESWSTILLEAGVAGPMATSDKQRGFRSRPRSGIEDSNNG